MTPTKIDRVSVSEAQQQTGLGRTGFYKRLGQAGIEPIKVSGRSYVTAEHLQALDDLQRWIDSGNDPNAWPGKLDQTVAAPIVPAVPRQLPVRRQPPAPRLEMDPEPEIQAPEELVAAEVEYLQKLLQFLDQAAERGWALPTSRVELLVGGKPRGGSLERYGFRFVPAGNHGHETAWRVLWANGRRRHFELMGFD